MVIAEPRIITGDPDLLTVLEEAKRLACTPVPVLLIGESGTGKELIARLLHTESGRREKPFVPLNCAALCENLAESELFGHVAGSFTGALRDRRGVFEETAGGTLFLDEVGDLSLAIQAKLLRVLQEGIVRRVGEIIGRKVHFRLVAATHRDLVKEREKGRFREDLFYRIHVVGLALPPLRRRLGDVRLLANDMVSRFSGSFGRRVAGIHECAIRHLEEYDWPGNVRELENELKRAVVLAEDGEWISRRHLTETIRSAGREVIYQPRTLQEKLGRIEKDEIVRTMDRMRGNKTRAARELGISRQGLKNKLIRYGLS